MEQLEPLDGPADGASIQTVRTGANAAAINSVSQLTALIKNAIADKLPPTVYVVGQASNVKRHANGHLYFTLSDPWSEIGCVMWRSAAQKLLFQLTDGQELLAVGAIEVFERGGRYQLYVRRLEPRGTGVKELAFRQLYQKLAALGLFEQSRKKTIPKAPRRMAVVTSKSGAALADILHTTARRYPLMEVLVYPVRVQGATAAGEIATALAALNQQQHRFGGIDVILLGRGGGSAEDLSAFNDEKVALAIAASRIPTISAVGHEIDVTIADLVADVRAATPTAAAELAVPDVVHLTDAIESFGRRILREAANHRTLSSARFDSIASCKAFRDPEWMFASREQALGGLESAMGNRLRRRAFLMSRRLDESEPKLIRIAPSAAITAASFQVRQEADRIGRSLQRRRLGAQSRLMQSSDLLMQTGIRRMTLQRMARLDHVAQMLAAGMRRKLKFSAQAMVHSQERLTALSVDQTLRRGFSIIREKKTGAIVHSKNQLRDHMRLTSRVSDGEFETVVVNLMQLDLFEQPS